MSGWVSLHRKLVDWEWYTDTNVKTVFIHCLLKANFSEKEWRGITLKRGQFVTSRAKLAQELGLSEQKIRLALTKLSKKEISLKTTNKYTVITVENYSIYQTLDDEEQPTKNQQRTNKKPRNNHQTTTTNNNNNKNNANNIYCPSDDEPQKSEKELIRDCFEKLWSLYPSKKGKSQVKATQRKYLFKHAADIEVAIKNYIQDVESQRANGFQDLRWLHGSTFFNGRYEDYLPGNYVPVEPKAVTSQKANNSVNNYMQRDYSSMSEEEFEAMHRCDVSQGVEQ